MVHPRRNTPAAPPEKDARRNTTILPTSLPERVSKLFFRVSDGKPRAGRVQGDNLALSVRQRKQVTLFGYAYVVCKKYRNGYKICDASL